MKGKMMKSEKSGYDSYSAVTFLLIGLGIGAVFGYGLQSKDENKESGYIEGINSRRPRRVQPQEEAKERVA
jgi:hypothetical protein